MELLKTVKRRTFWSEVVYQGLNIGLVAALFVLSQTIQSPVIATVLVLLSKWRVLAVRPRYWWANIQANMVDVIVGLGVVALMYAPGMTLYPQAGLAAAYALWLVVIKPLSKRWQMVLQAVIALVVGSAALLIVSYEWPVLSVAAGMFIIGYSVARHFLYSHDDEHMVQLSLIWGVIYAEMGWLAHFWTFSYGVAGALATALRLPQMTIILLLLSFVGERIYTSWRKHGEVQTAEMLAPVLFAFGLIAAMLIVFNSVVI